MKKLFRNGERFDHDGDVDYGEGYDGDDSDDGKHHDTVGLDHGVTSAPISGSRSFHRTRLRFHLRYRR